MDGDSKIGMSFESFSFIAALGHLPANNSRNASFESRRSFCSSSVSKSFVASVSTCSTKSLALMFFLRAALRTFKIVIGVTLQPACFLLFSQIWQ